MVLFKKVVILGTGLIGGSLGLALKEKRLAGEVLGLSRSRKNALLAKKIGAIGRPVFSLSEVSSADLVILAAPIETIIELGGRISGLLNEDCVVIDVASTKEAVVRNLSNVLPNFLGCHPLTGSENKGIIFARKDLFKGSLCILTPDKNTKSAVLKKVKLLWKKLAVTCVVMPAKKHDQILAFTSHLPHAVAFSLNLAVPDKYLKFCAGSFKDTTRIASSDACLWSQIFLSNPMHLLHAIKSFERNLAGLKSAIESNDQVKLTKILLISNKKDKYKK
ncbi:MAG: prephenate dehydrogenase [Candidatus Omnitrophica bacterium]|jgi:prephenate dehydrogenase|nr:prephenate dehydrogenase [Candidatus Omnitrophota bacterium]